MTQPAVANTNTTKSVQVSGGHVEKGYTWTAGGAPPLISPSKRSRKAAYCRTSHCWYAASVLPCVSASACVQAGKNNYCIPRRVDGQAVSSGQVAESLSLRTKAASAADCVQGSQHDLCTHTDAPCV